MQTQNASTLKTLLDTTPGVILIDVTRETYFDAHHIPSAINIPYRTRKAGSSKNFFLKFLEERGFAKDAPIVVYSEHPGCKLAYMAGLAIAGEGYTNVTTISDGLYGWIRSGNTTEPKQIDTVPSIEALEAKDPITQTLLADGYVTLSLEDTTLPQKAGSAFTEFMSLPFEVLGTFVAPESHKPTHPFRHIGYRSYAQPEAGRPTQELFVYNAEIHDMFAEQIAKHKEAQHYVETARELLEAGRALFKKTLTEMEHTFPGLHNAYYAEGKTPIDSLWFLKYQYADASLGEEMSLCRPHFDFGATSISLGESAQGLRLGRTQESLEFPPPRSDGEVLMFPAIEFFRKTHPDMPSMWHDVLQKRSDGYDDTIARWAVQFFADPLKGDECTVCNEPHPLLY